ncbi:unnamed protein product [Acanthoscelides obtectus]|nr:unnamed protein product [Acanthoscelides obtectus]CAK1647310.1 Protein arginine methyltransferase NDUFAF7 homolog, mitochondrial [Acanthoscelides obtectus]
MREVLVNPMAGYYMHKDMLGESGDFITSPEITQMFGEMIAVWLINEWQKAGSPRPIHIIELGPGRGTLSNDILNVFNHFKVLHKASLHLVEVSPFLSSAQARRLCIQSNLTTNDGPAYRRGISHHGIPVFWYNQLEDVPPGFTLLIAHEFFDALPIHKFHKVHGNFKEVLIDIDTKDDPDIKGEYKFRYVLSRNDTPMLQVLITKGETRDHVEVAPDSIRISKLIAERIKKLGGVALICDYGHFGTGTDTFRAFKQHKQVDPLMMPGTADLTADVDFKLLCESFNSVKDVLCLGPVTQRDFLLETGLEYRFEALKNTIKDAKHIANLTNCYNYLTDNDKMGERFKFLAVFPSVMKKIFERCPVIGFQAAVH